MKVRITDKETIRILRKLLPLALIGSEEGLFTFWLDEEGLKITTMNTNQSCLFHVIIDIDKIEVLHTYEKLDMAIDFSDSVRVITRMKYLAEITIGWNEKESEFYTNLASPLLKVVINKLCEFASHPKSLLPEKLDYNESTIINLQDRGFNDSLHIFDMKGNGLVFKTDSTSLIVSQDIDTSDYRSKEFITVIIPGIQFEKNIEHKQKFSTDVIAVLMKLSELRGVKYVRVKKGENKKKPPLVERIEFGVDKPLRFTKSYENSGVTVDILQSPITETCD
jgi:hypothetical protein